MIDQATNVVWRMDIAVQQAVRDSVVQGSVALRDLAAGANWWGGLGVIWFAAALWLGGRALRRAPLARVGLRGAEALALASAVSGIVKGITGRARPFVTPGEPWHWELNRGWTDAQFFSMPSGHTTATMAFSVGVLIATRGWATKTRMMLAVPLFATPVAVAFARMFTDLHWLSDIVVALTIGTVTSVVLGRIHAKAKCTKYDRLMLGADAPSAGGHTRA